MSKVVKKVGRTIKKVVKGVVNVVKKVAKSKLGKIILTAAAVYFGGAALMGGIGGATSSVAGTSFLSGASAGLGSAMNGITGAWSALTGTGGLSGAASSLGSGFTGALQAGTGGTMMAGMTQAQMLAAQNAGLTGATGLTNTAAATAFPTGSTVGSAALQLTPPAAGGAAATGMGEMTKYALVNGAMQLGGNLMAAKGQAEEEQAQRDRYDASVAEFGNSARAQAGQYANQPGSYGTPGMGVDYGAAPSPQFGNTALLQDQQRRGLVAAQMQNPTFGMAQFPVYNPRTYG